MPRAARPGAAIPAGRSHVATARLTAPKSKPPPAMILIPLSAVRIPDRRQRSSIDADSLGELVSSIQTNGLLHPPVVRQVPGGQWELVAGERRFRAIELLQLQGARYTYSGQLVPDGKIPVHDLQELSAEQAYAVELEENIIRVDLSWQDRALAISRLTELRALQAQVSPRSQELQAQVAAEAFPEISDVAAKQTVRQALAVTAHMTDPDVAKAKSQAEAFKVVLRKQAAVQNLELARSTGQLAKTERFEVINADCREWLAGCTEGTYDVVLIDPPYGMGADTFGDAAGKLAGIDHQYDDSASNFVNLMSQVIAQLVRVMKPSSHLYIWCDIDGFRFLRDTCQALGLWTFRTPLINIKREGGRVPWPEHGPRRAYELVLYANKGKRPVTSIMPDVFESSLEAVNAGHGAQKPIEAYVNLLKRSCRPGDRVLDCFAGSGTILSAAAELNLRATAVEQYPTNYGLCLKRLEGLK